jgi:hypothetical protein
VDEVAARIGDVGQQTGDEVEGIECAAVAGWNGHEVVHAEPGMGLGEE